MNDKPRYENIYVADKKHILRSMNKYVEYDYVKKMNLSFDYEKNKYQIKLNENSSYGLVYDRFYAKDNLTSTSKILAVVKSFDMQELHQQSVLEEIEKIVKSYALQNNQEYNKIFLVDKNEVIEKFKQIVLTRKEFYTQYPSMKKVDISLMVAKRVYFTIFNKLNFYMNTLNKITNNQYILEEDSLERLKKEFEVLREKKQIIEKQTISSDIYEEGVIPYEDLITAIELYDDPNFDISNLAPEYNLQMLIDEKYMHDSNTEVHLFEYNKKLELKNLFYIEAKEYFSDYVKIKRYIEKNNKNFTKNSITRYIKHVLARVESFGSLSGLKRRISFKELQKDFGLDFKAFKKKIESFSIKDEIDFLNRIMIANEFKDILELFSKEELDLIFDNLPLTLEKKDEIYYTQKEIKSFNPSYDEVDGVYHPSTIKFMNYFDNIDETYEQELIYNSAYDISKFIDDSEKIDEYFNSNGIPYSLYESILDEAKKIIQEQDEQNRFEDERIEKLKKLADDKEYIRLINNTNYGEEFEYCENIPIKDIVEAYGYKLKEDISLEGTFSNVDEMICWVEENKEVEKNIFTSNNDEQIPF